MTRHPDETPASDRDEAIAERIRKGGAPDSDDALERALAAFKAEADEGIEDDR